MALVDERLPFLKEKQVHGQRQLLQTDLLGARLLGFDDADVLLHGQLLRCLRFGWQLQRLSEPGLELLQLRVFFLHQSSALELVQDLQQIEVALMQLLVLEVGPREPVAADVAVDLDLRTLVLDVALYALQSLDLLQTSEALDLESLALIFNVLLKVLQEDALLHLLRGAAV